MMRIVERRKVIVAKIGVTDKRERPRQSEGEFQGAIDISDRLPVLARAAGMELRSVTFVLDPVVLYNRFGQIVHEWPCGYDPTWCEVYEVCQQLGDFVDVRRGNTLYRV